MDPEYLNSLFNPQLYGPLNAAYRNELPNPPSLGMSLNPATASTTNTAGQLLDAAGNPVLPPGSPGASPIGGDVSSIPAAAAPTGGGGGAPGTSSLTAALRGIQAPPRPEVQRVATPHAPPIRPIAGGGLVNMLASLGIGPREALQLPTLRQTLGRG